MCTNFNANLDTLWSRRHFGLEMPVGLPPEAYPGFLAPLLRIQNADLNSSLILNSARFGLVPRWTQRQETERISRFTYNARSESASTKPSYRAPYRQRQWGIALVKDFFEPSYESGRAQRMRISLLQDEPFGIACLWDEWRPHEMQIKTVDESMPKFQQAKEEGVILSFSMLTLNADRHPVMSRMHAPTDEKRTPLVLSVDQFKPWLNASSKEAKEWLSGVHMPELKAELAPRSKPTQKQKTTESTTTVGHSISQGQLF
jgi:putative SOS response-associated peptidase YedK